MVMVVKSKRRDIGFYEPSLFAAQRMSIFVFREA